MLLLASLLRLGFVANFISDPVLAGFKSGIGLVIVVDQIPKLFGFHIEKAGFFRDLLAMVQHLPQTSAATLALAVVTLLLIFGLERFAPRVPAPLIAVGVGIAASALLALPDAGVATVGSIPRGLPSLVLPQFDLLAQLWPAAAGIALMSFTESIAAARAFTRSSEPRLVPNQELRALGVANFIGGLFGAMPAGGGTTQTAVNRRAGAHSQMAELVTAAAAVATMVLLAPLIAWMPHAVLAAVVVAYSVELISPAEFRVIARVRRTEVYWAVIAFAGVALLGTLKGILVAVIASLVALAPTGIRSARLCDRSQTRDACLQAAVGGTPGRRDLARLADTANRGAVVLRQRPAGRGQDLAADREDEAVRHLARLQRYFRYRIHCPQDARGGGGEAAARGHHALARGPEPGRAHGRQAFKDRRSIGPRPDVFQPSDGGRAFRADDVLELG